MNVGSSTSNGSACTGSIAPVVLTILDGWGHRDEEENNAIRQGDTPVMEALWHAYPHTLIQASGSHVGLPDQQMGNSEVGHLTIGAGRIIRQELVRIGETVRNDKLKSTPELQKLAERVKAAGNTLHLLGLCSDGGVHSHVDHLCGVIRWAAEAGITKVAVHVITDGRDTPTQSAPGYVKAVQESIQATGVGAIASLCGRYWAMDRDQRWERTDKAYRLYTDPGMDVDERDPEDILTTSYRDGITDEFLEPARLQHTVMQDGDALLIFNFRPDRARQIVQALCLDEFDGFHREHTPNLDVLTFTQLEQNLPVSVAFPPEPLNNLLGQVVSEAGLLQYRTAETEKYPHVTYFMNGGIEQPLKGEERHLVPSPRVATYDLSPAMSADELTASCIKAIETRKYALIVINYANPDMVGHTGMMDAAKEAIQTVDTCIGRLLNAICREGGTMLITADHGNAELMQGADGQAWTAHTTNPVPVILVEGEQRKIPGHGNAITLRDNGGLADIAPTLLQILDLQQPSAMTGNSLIAAMSNVDPSPLSARLPQTV